MVLKLKDEFSVPGISKVSIEVNHNLYIQLWGLACEMITQALGKYISRTELNRMGHKVIAEFFRQVMDAAIRQTPPEVATVVIKDLVQRQVQDFIPGVTEV